MSEIEKLMQNAGVELKRECEFESYCPLGFGHSCESCDVDMRDDNSAYPPFTVEKQLSLIKWLAYKMHITIGKGLPWGTI